jgi:uncharacterized protein (DUF111 family)
MTIHRSGNGAGSRDFEGFPNLLRLFKGKSAPDDDAPGAVIIECGIDDVSPEYLAPATEALQAAGAREVHVIPAFTKKGRMGVLLRVLASETEKQAQRRAAFLAGRPDGAGQGNGSRKNASRHCVVQEVARAIRAMAIQA